MSIMTIAIIVRSSPRSGTPRSTANAGSNSTMPTDSQRLAPQTPYARPGHRSGLFFVRSNPLHHVTTHSNG